MKRLLFLLSLFPSLLFAQGNFVKVSTSTYRVTYPTNFWDANAADILEAIGGSSGGTNFITSTSSDFQVSSGVLSVTNTTGTGPLVRLSAAGSGGGTGTVTSVALTVPSILSVSGSPITNTGTFVLTLALAPANRVLIGPTNGADAEPTFRRLVEVDIPSTIATEAEVAAGYQPLKVTLTRVGDIGLGTLGDLIGRDATGWTNIPAGSAGQALFQKLGGGFAWSNVVASGSSGSGLSYTPTNITWSGLTIVSDCSKSYFFRVFLTNTTPATLQAPTNATDGAVVRWEFQQDTTGSREIVLGTGLQGGNHITGIYLSTNANYVDYASAIYRQSSNIWNIISNPGGYP